MSAKDNLLIYLQLKGVKKTTFYKETGLSNGYLDKNPNISSDKLEIIISNYPDLNLSWLLTGRGEMLNKSVNKGSSISIKGDNSGVITANTDNRQYYSDSPDVLREQIFMLDEQNKALQEQNKALQEQLIAKEVQVGKLINLLSDGK